MAIFSFQSVAGVSVEGGVMKMQICDGGKKGTRRVKNEEALPQMREVMILLLIIVVLKRQKLNE